MSSFWREIGYFAQTMGIPAIIGVLVGAGTTRRQKNKEALQGIRSANYREVVLVYTELTVHLQHAYSAAGRMLVAAHVILHMRSSDQPEVSQENIRRGAQELEDKYLEYQRLRAGLPAKMAPISVHLGSEPFYEYLRFATSSVDMLDHSLRLLTYELTEDTYGEADTQHNEFRDKLSRLNESWAKWKENAEKAAAGLHVQPARRR